MAGEVHAVLELLLSLAPAALAPSPSPLPGAEPCPRVAQDPDPEEERVKRAVAELEQAFRDGDAEARARAVLAHAGVDDPRTIEWFARAVRDGAREVQSAGLGALARAMHPEALKALHKVYGKDKELRRDEELGVQLLKAIGAHESPESIELLAGDVFDGRAEPIVEARILALGRIRDRRSVEELVGIMKKGGRERVAPFMDELRLSLLVLTGADRGTSLEEWLAWWNDNKKTLEVRPEPAQLPERDWLRWARYWGFELRYERPTRREDRGDD